MHSSHFLAFLVLASSAAVHARFGQEQKAQLAAKLNTAGCVGADGSRLVDKFSGQEISKLLAAAGACDKITLADQVVAAGRDLCGSNADQFNGVIDAAIDLVQAEHNFNPFVTLQDIVCTDASLPSESVLRGIVQIVDPFDAAPNDNDAARKERAAKVNAASASVVAAAKAAHSGPGFTGSMADLVVQNGLLAADIKGGAAGGGDNGGGAAATTTTVTVTVTTDAGAAPTGGAVVSGCNAKQMQYIVQGNEHRFALDGAQVALNPAIPAQRICDNLRNNKASSECISACETASAAIVASGAKGFSNGNDAAKDNANAKAADDFNLALGSTTNFAAQFPANGLVETTTTTTEAAAEPTTTEDAVATTTDAAGATTTDAAAEPTTTDAANVDIDVAALASLLQQAVDIIATALAA